MHYYRLEYIIMQSVLKSMCFQPFRLRQPCLPFVESPEAVGLEFQRAGDVQAVERAHAEFGTVTAGESSANIEGSFRNRTFRPNVMSAILISTDPKASRHASSLGPQIIPPFHEIV